MADLQPLPGFDWAKVVWGGPKDHRTSVCSYCREPLGEGVPLILWTKAGDCAEFCRACMRTWWGFASIDEDDDG